MTGTGPALTAEELDRVRAQATEEYPSECCGVVLARPGRPDDRVFLRCRNVQDELHRRDPERHGRDARTAYYIDPKDLLTIGRHEGTGYRVRTIYHSHIDAGAYFSETDRRNAMLGDEPSYPQATYVVTSVMTGRVDGMAAFRWDATQRDFVARELAANDVRSAR